MSGSSAHVDNPESNPRCRPSSNPHVVTTQEQVDSLAGCEVIGGMLVVAPPEGVTLDLRPLASLRRVEGHLSLGCFAWVNSGCSFDAPFGFESDLGLEGLERLELVGGLSLSGLRVTSLAPLRNLRTIEDAALSITDCNELTSLDGLHDVAVTSLTLANNKRLASTKGVLLAPLASSVSLTGLPALTDLSVLGPLTSVDQLGLGSLPFQNLDAVSNLAQARSLSLIDMPQLSDISALARLRELDELRIEGTALENLDALQLATVKGELSVARNRALVSMDTLGGIERLGALRVHDNVALTRLPTFTNVADIARIDVSSNALLVHGPSFPSLHGMGSGTITISSNATLERIDGFSNLQQASSIEILGNPKLQVVEFPSLQTAPLLRITCNAALSELSLRPLLSVSSSDLMLEGNLESPGYCESF